LDWFDRLQARIPDPPVPGFDRPSPPAAVAGAIRLWLAASLVGILAAATTLGFRALIDVVEYIATGEAGSLVAAAMKLAPWRRALIGAAGG